MLNIYNVSAAKKTINFLPENHEKHENPSDYYTLGTLGKLFFHDRGSLS